MQIYILLLIPILLLNVYINSNLLKFKYIITLKKILLFLISSHICVLVFNVDWRLFVPGSAVKPEKDTLQTIDTDCYTVSTVYKCIQNYIEFLSGKDMYLHPELSK